VENTSNFSKILKHFQYLAADEVNVKFKGRAVCKQYTPKKCKHFGTKMFKLCDYWIYMTRMFTSVKTDKGQHNT